MGHTPDSLKSVELANWTVIAFIGKRLHLQQIRNRRELSEPGIYLLLSDRSDSTGPLTQFYVGETDNFLDRIAQHAQSKDWWSNFVVFVSKDQNLTKAHVKFLERELYLLAKASIGTLQIMNSVEPSGTRLPESDVSTMKEFLRNMEFVLETLGLSYFPRTTTARGIQQSITSSAVSVPIAEAPTAEFAMSLPRDIGLLNGRQYAGIMRIGDGTFVLKRGSYIRATPSKSFENQRGYFELWKQITTSDSVQSTSNPELLQIMQDIEFRSPSAAGAIVRAQATDGRSQWKRISDGKPLSECELEEAAQLTQTTASDDGARGTK